MALSILNTWIRKKKFQELTVQIFKYARCMVMVSAAMSYSRGKVLLSDLEMPTTAKPLCQSVCSFATSISK